MNRHEYEQKQEEASEAITRNLDHVKELLDEASYYEQEANRGIKQMISTSLEYRKDWMTEWDKKWEESNGEE